MKISFELMGLSLLGLYNYYNENMPDDELRAFQAILVNNFRKNGWNGAEFMKELSEKDKNPKENEEDLDKLRRIIWQVIEEASTNPFGL